MGYSEISLELVLSVSYFNLSAFIVFLNEEIIGNKKKMCLLNVYWDITAQIQKHLCFTMNNGLMKRNEFTFECIENQSSEAVSSSPPRRLVEKMSRFV